MTGELPMDLVLCKIDANDEDQVGFLWDLLKERPPEANISHRQMPTQSEHWAFVGSHPYQHWYIVRVGAGDMAAAIYLTHRSEIGIAVLSRWQRKGIAKRAIALLMLMHPRPRYLANIAPGNQASQTLFKSLGATIIQHTFDVPYEN